MKDTCVFGHYLRCFLDTELLWAEMSFEEQEAAFIGMTEAEDAIRAQYPDIVLRVQDYCSYAQIACADGLSFKEWTLRDQDQGYW